MYHIGELLQLKQKDSYVTFKYVLTDKKALKNRSIHGEGADYVIELHFS